MSLLLGRTRPTSDECGRTRRFVMTSCGRSGRYTVPGGGSRAGRRGRPARLPGPRAKKDMLLFLNAYPPRVNRIFTEVDGLLKPRRLGLPVGGRIEGKRSLPAAVVDWLLDSDPSIRWQVMRDLQDRPRPSGARNALGSRPRDGCSVPRAGGPGRAVGRRRLPPERLRTRGVGAVGQPWTATSYVLSQLRELGLDPASDSAKRAVGSSVRAANGGRGSRSGRGRPRSASTAGSSPTVPTTAWTCPRWSATRRRAPRGGRLELRAANGSTRSSFDSTINVLEGLAEHERATAGRRVAGRETRRRGVPARAAPVPAAEHRRTGGPGLPSFMHPNRWHYDVLRGLDYFRSVADLGDGPPDPRLAEAVEVVSRRRTADGRWLLDRTPRGRVWFESTKGRSTVPLAHPACAEGAALVGQEQPGRP